MNQTINNKEEAPFLLASLLQNIVSYYKSLIGHWKILVLMGLIGLVLGSAYVLIKNDTYTASTTFVVEDNKSASGGIASALAGQFGFDIGGLSSGSGVLQGDNVLGLLKSKTLIKKALLTTVDSVGSVSVADLYANAYGYSQKWLKSKEVGYQVRFNSNPLNNVRLEDSLLHVIIKRITTKELSILKPDKKLSLFSIDVTTRNENLSKLLCERILKVTSEFYIATKTKRIRGNVDRLQQRVDSLKMILNQKTSSSIDASRDLLDINPVFSQNQEVNAEISGRDKIVQATVFAELTKNLEASKTILLQETPTIQVVDAPELPLKKNETSWLFSIFIGIASLEALTIIGLFFFKKVEVLKPVS